MQGFLLALQFFTIVPITRQFDLHTKNATMMYSCFPVIGLLIGCLDVAFLQLMTYTEFSALFVAIFFILLHATYTGGLHMDGFVDMGDAFFSYRDMEKRVAILDDPRVGAFGAMSLVAIVLMQLAIVHELVIGGQWLALVIVPMLVRIGALYCFSAMPLAKETGIAAFFRKVVDVKKLGITVGVMALLIVVLLSLWQLVLLAVPVVLLVATFVYRVFCVRNFGGVSGDLIGAYVTSMEVLLWFVVLLCN
ncbi:adenosylcobinamide-GDP ribazoletransferase [Caryophanon latum]|uniref:adenosylcobinamide-GDP ribazoletransferase n=1 Tax=Caryophanon latum TaxID=33977 RepID=UPI000B0F62DE|nr:adenosylcobinamide-GDP ribazoletransferase [Caryophanon latum]